MLRKISADYICPVTSEPLENSVVVTDVTGRILDISSKNNFDPAEVETHSGTIVPGFVNTHCHLELSHLKGVAKTGTGLIEFISQIIKNRNHSQEIIKGAIELEELKMIESGIVAVGDISNTADSFAQKKKGNLYYYTFVEYFDLFQEAQTEIEIEKYNKTYAQLIVAEKNKKSKVPHAPYSVSEKLFKYLSDPEFEGGVTVSIHNQETIPENELFQNNTGDFISFYERLNLSTKHIPLLGKSAVHYALVYLKNKNRNIFVHNILTTKEDIRMVQQKLGNKNVFWATCPNANLYIENQLPNYQLFLDTGAQITIGTDSLASNWQLSILEEMKTIFKFQSHLDFQTILKWATINGAKALGFENQLGSIEIGKTPGLVLIENMKDGKLTQTTTSKRII